MRRFVFLGSKKGWFGEGVIEYDGFKLCTVYYENEKSRHSDFTVLDFARVFPDDWKEVGENVKIDDSRVSFITDEKLLHQTDLGYYSGEFLKSVFNNPECSKGSREEPMSAESIVKWSIDISKELIKQLKEEE